MDISYWEQRSNNKGKVYKFDGIMNEVTPEFEDIETFFQLVGIYI